MIQQDISTVKRITIIHLKGTRNRIHSTIARCVRKFKGNQMQPPSFDHFTVLISIDIRFCFNYSPCIALQSNPSLCIMHRTRYIPYNVKIVCYKLSRIWKSISYFNIYTALYRVNYFKACHPPKICIGIIIIYDGNKCANIFILWQREHSRNHTGDSKKINNPIWLNPHVSNFKRKYCIFIILW